MKIIYLNTVVILWISLCKRIACNVIVSNSVNATANEPRKTIIPKSWDASNMPNPQKCPKCCGLESPGWICDPDNAFSQKEIGGFEGAINLLNEKLNTLANKSMCPCTQCGGRNTTFFVYVAKSLRNSRNLPVHDVISNFATELMTSHERETNKRSTCKQHIVMAMDVDDNLIHMSIGESVNRSGLMTYKDVQTLWSAFSAFSVNEHTYLLLDLTIKAVTKYTEQHPKVLQKAETTSGDAKASGLDTVAIVILVIVCVVAVILGIGIPVYCGARRDCCGKDAEGGGNSKPITTIIKAHEKKEQVTTT